MKTKSLLLTLGIVFVVPVYSQVTIGSDLPTRKGSLLEIKEDNSKGTNSSKGFGLPRVELTSLSDLPANYKSPKGEYKGLTLYHIGTPTIKAGPYYWDGEKWKHLVTVQQYGKNGQTLISRGDGTYDWYTFTIPTYTVNYPTQITSMEKEDTTSFVYPMNKVMANVVQQGGAGDWFASYGPETGLYNNDFVFRHPLTMKSESSNMRYLLLGLTVKTNKRTYLNKDVVSGYWEKIKIDILLDGNGKNNYPIKEYERGYSTAAGGRPDMYVDLFSVIPLENITKGDYTLKVRVGVMESIFLRNTVRSPGPWVAGQFMEGDPNFCTISIVDINFILYEEK